MRLEIYFLTIAESSNMGFTHLNERKKKCGNEKDVRRMKNKRSEVEETSDTNEKIEREMKKEGRERNGKRVRVRRKAENVMINFVTCKNVLCRQSSKVFCFIWEYPGHQKWSNFQSE